MAARGAREATGGAAMKKRGRETTKLKGRNALPVARHRGPTAADLQKQLDQRTRELADFHQREGNAHGFAGKGREIGPALRSDRTLPKSNCVARCLRSGAPPLRVT